MKNKISIEKCSKIIVPKKTNEAFEVGYLDGYFNEEAYFYYITGNHIISYNSGYSFGAEKRKNTDIEKINIQKEEWITKLAINDAINLNFDRRISDEYKELYDLNFDDVSKGIESEVSSDYFEKLVEERLVVVDSESPWGYRFLDKSNVKVRK